MKRFTLLTILFALLGVSQAWAGKVKIQLYSSPTTGGYVYANTANTNNIGTLTSDDATSSYKIGGSVTMYRFAQAKDGYTFSGWAESDGGTPSSTSSSISLGASGGIDQKTYTFYAIFTPISYSFVYHGNGSTSGTMANQTFKYGTAQNLRANVFERSYSITYNANGGNCAETSAVAQYTFGGWATSETGAVVYSNKQNISNLTTVDGMVYNVYAKWTGGQVILPEATNGEMLFDGWYNGDTWVGKAGDSYAVTGDVELTAHWAEKLTPMFVLDKSVIEPGETAKLTLTNVNNPIITIAPEGIIDYNSETGVITALSAGKATISITQEATSTLSYKHDDLAVAVKLLPSLKIKLNNVVQSGITIYQGKSTTVSFEKVSDANVVVSTLSGGKSASYSNGTITAGEVGTAIFRATLPETDTYKGLYMDFSVTVIADLRHLPMTLNRDLWTDGNIKVASKGDNSWDDTKGIVLGDVNWGGTTWDDKYVILHFEGIPDKLSFQIATQGLAGGPTQVEWYVQESPTKEMNGGKIWTSSYGQGTMDFADTHTIQLDPTTRYVKLCYSGNFGGYIRNVQIGELKYVQNPEPASIDFGKAVIYTGEIKKTVNVNWCNIAPMSVVSSNPRFTVTPSVFGNYDQMGSQEITISYTHTSEVGPNEADITISNGNATYTKTVHVAAETTKRIQTVTWNSELVATGFAMNVGERYPDITIPVIATTPNGDTVTYTSSNSDVIEVINDTVLLAKAQGTAEITAYQKGDAEYAEVSDTKLFTVTDLRKQTITWEQNFYGLLTTSEPIELTATATSGMPVQYSSANENVVRIDGNMLIVVGEGETTITATQAGGVDTDEVEWLPINLNNFVIVRNPASQCNGMALSVGSMELSAGNLSKEYVLAGAPTTLTFSAKHGTKSNGAWGQKPTYAALMVDQYTKVDGVWGWQTIYNTVVGTDATASGTLTLDEGATKLRFRTSESETEHTISNIRVPRKKYMRASAELFDENAETNAIWQKTITVSHSNIDMMTLATKHGILSLSANTLGEGCDDYGDDDFTVSFNPKEKSKEYFDTIVITDGKSQPSTIEIPVRLYSTGLNQYIEGFELPESCLITETVASFKATATSGLDVVYLSSDSAVAYVENNKLVILSAGTVKITAYQAGDERYESASETKTIVISLVPVTILEAPTATNVALGQALGMAELRGGKASVDGTFAWVNPELIPEAGTKAYPVVFTPANGAIYATAKTDVEVLVVEHPTTYGELTLSICAGDSVLYADKWYKTAGTEEVNFEGANIYAGDSIVVLTVSVKEPSAGAEEKTITVGAEDAWHGVALKEYAVGEYEWNDTLVNAVGCDSVVILTLTVNKIETLEVPVELSFCAGGSVDFRGKEYMEAGVDKVPFAGATRDTLYIVNVTELQPTFGEEEKTITVGDDVEWNGKLLKDSTVGVHMVVFETTNAVGCDSTITLTLTVNKIETLNVPVELSFCAGGSETYRGTEYKEAGEYKVPAEGETRDTLYVVNVTILQPTASEEKKTITYGDKEMWNGYDLSGYAIGMYELNYKTTNAVGCDSTVTLALTVAGQDALEVPEAISFCAGDVKEYRGKEFMEAGTENILVKGETRDTIYVVTATLLQPTFGAEEKTITCGDKETWKGHDLSGYVAGVFELKENTVNAVGCDSTITLTLTVNKIETLNVPVELSFCAGGSVDYRGTEYTKAGKYEVPAEGATRDTLYAVNVTELQPTASAEEKTIVAGKQEMWNGYDLSTYEAGQHEVVYKTANAVGCDSTVTLTLTVLSEMKTYGEYKAHICDDDVIEFNGDTYTTAVTEQEVLMKEKNSYGGDSIVILTITAGKSSKSQEIYRVITYGAQEMWNAHDLSTYAIGEHKIVDEYKNITGCDSIMTLHLTVEKAQTLELERELIFCEGDSVEFHGVWYKEEIFTWLNIEGVGQDTIYEIYVTMSYPERTDLQEKYYVGDALVINEEGWFIVDEEDPFNEPTPIAAGSYPLTEAMPMDISRTYQTVGGCDSVVVRHITVEPKPIATGMEDVQGDEVTCTKVLRNGVIYIRRGDHLYMTDGKKAQ